MLRFLIPVLLCTATVAALAELPAVTTGTIADPYTILEFNGSSPPTGGASSGYGNAAGKTLVSSGGLSSYPIILTIGQSLAASNSVNSYATVNATALNFNIYDGGTYHCDNPVLGASGPDMADPGGGLQNNSPNCPLADKLITAGTYTGVIMVTIAVDGTKAADWNSAPLTGRITVAMKRLNQIYGRVPTYVVWHQGESDANAGTSGAAYTASVQAVASQFRALFSFTGPFFVSTETMVSNAVNSTIQTAQANAVSAGLHIVAGSNIDSLTGGTNRQSDGTHLTAAGSLAFAGLDQTIITNCKNSSC